MPLQKPKVLPVAGTSRHAELELTSARVISRVISRGEAQQHLLRAMTVVINQHHISWISPTHLFSMTCMSNIRLAVGQMYRCLVRSLVKC